MSPASPPQEVFVISFFTEKAGAAAQGTVSLIDQVPKSTWTIQSNGSRQTFDRPISEDSFRHIWDRISALTELDSYLSTDPGQAMSFTDHYIVGIIYVLSGKEGRRLYMIPHNCSAQSVLSWVQDIESTSKGS
ncbi:hypothetical protein DES53_102893 [Roseimicrobium gellanilyticum]|uniref:Uncharacterized protein n=1 Tax=Roseimicrobium gellanilyticum TaxID=748857 RepID=A0A366HS49_9BACT|nr:hypothetical protein [Roseimicrobium gellanilyticum]RBP46502.1 hypothetical protein DES53_102893 [Roseimicrobium gellanilyticum]